MTYQEIRRSLMYVTYSQMSANNIARTKDIIRVAYKRNVSEQQIYLCHVFLFIRRVHVDR